ncbi:hypothetical protein [Acidovorax sp. Leaf73]|jgi:hypothetical protein|uniref:hypothetical protein n=1 Tax=Acidovorax sp. Leaf73 TaxID=2876566 RepID=UPI001E5F7643|nr:hypothetical protein [Acidovorax sp. Leaf73]
MTNPTPIKLRFAPLLPALQLEFAKRVERPLAIATAYVGPPGPPGGMTYTHTQAIATAVWTVAHNLGRRPSVSVTDHLGNVVHADVRYLDDDMVQITHGSALIGFAYCN